jgi:hypothetical protein
LPAVPNCFALHIMFSLLLLQSKTSANRRTDPRRQRITGILYKYLSCGLPGQIQQCLFQYP